MTVLPDFCILDFYIITLAIPCYQELQHMTVLPDFCILDFYIVCRASPANNYFAK